MYLEHRLSALLQLHLHSRLNNLLHWIEQRHVQDETRNIYIWGFCAPYIRYFTVLARPTPHITPRNPDTKVLRSCYLPWTWGIFTSTTSLNPMLLIEVGPYANDFIIWYLLITQTKVITRAGEIITNRGITQMFCCKSTMLAWLLIAGLQQHSQLLTRFGIRCENHVVVSEFKRFNLIKNSSRK